VYNAAALGVIMNTKTKKQRYFCKNNDDITAICVSQDGKMVATGEVGSKPSVFVWDTTK
jgi:microtubule-associated protein-like 6